MKDLEVGNVLGWSFAFLVGVCLSGGVAVGLAKNAAREGAAGRFSLNGNFEEIVIFDSQTGNYFLGVEKYNLWHFCDLKAAGECTRIEKKRVPRFGR